MAFAGGSRLRETARHVAAPSPVQDQGAVLYRYAEGRMSAAGMDSRITTQERAFRMILVLLDCVQFEPEQRKEIRRRIRGGDGFRYRAPFERRIADLPCRAAAPSPAEEV